MSMNSQKFSGLRSAGFKVGLSCAIASALLFAGASAHATTINLVQNGDFAENSGVAGKIGTKVGTTTVMVTDWTNGDYRSGSVGYNFLYFPSKTSPDKSNGIGLYTVTSGPHGENFIGDDADYESAPISQTINGLVAGKQYVLSFEWAAGQQTGFYGPTKQDWDVTLGTQSQKTNVYNLPGEVKNGPTIQNFSGWMPDSMIFTATGSSEVLSFLAQGSPQVPPFTLLADVSLVEAPEPGTTTLLFTGLFALAGFGLFQSRRRRAQQAL